MKSFLFRIYLIVSKIYFSTKLKDAGDNSGKPMKIIPWRMKTTKKGTQSLVINNFHLMLLWIFICCSSDMNLTGMTRTQLYSICTLQTVQEFIQTMDFQFYQVVVDVLVPNVLKPIPSMTLVKSVFSFKTDSILVPFSR